MIDANTIASRYLALWNEQDPERRRQLVAAAFTADATYIDPLMQGTGHHGLDEMIAAARQQFPGHVFTAHGHADTHHDVVRFSWYLADQGGAPVAYGTDIARVANDGRLRNVTGFLDPAQAPT